MKTQEQMGEALLNLEQTAPNGITDKEMRQWLRENGIETRHDGTYHFKSEQDFDWFLLKWS